VRKQKVLFLCTHNQARSAGARNLRTREGRRLRRRRREAAEEAATDDSPRKETPRTRGGG
jgi:protein-tyrosine-phosphatase